MEILISKYDEILSFLIKNRNEGNEFVAYPKEVVILDKDQLECFRDHYEASEFCYENSTDVDRYQCLSIRSAYRAMAINRHDLQHKSAASTVDIDRLVTDYHSQIQARATNNQQKNNVMIQKNLEYLNKQASDIGFDDLEDQLKENMKELKPVFNLFREKTVDGTDVSVSLPFKKSTKSDMYFLNKYDVHMKSEGSDEVMNQTFYTNKGITLEEGVNLMKEGSVNKDLKNKEGEEYNTWLYLDFKETDVYGNYKIKSNSKFDLDAALAKYSVKESADESFRESLKRGNREAATFVVNGKEQTGFVEAHARFNDLKLYDSNGQRVDTRQAQKQAESKKEAQSQASADEEGAPRKSTRKKKGQSAS